MKTKLLGLAVLAALIAAGAALSASPPIVARALAIGQTNAFHVDAKAGSMIIDSLKVNPGGSFGWHTHGSAVAVVIKSGTLTVYDPTVANCAAQHVTAGQSFIEPANHLHLARNETKKPATLYVVYLGVPKGAQPNQPGKAPAGCTS
jgi:quercetin dioxygenase-like cupin family protein